MKKSIVILVVLLLILLLIISGCFKQEPPENSDNNQNPTQSSGEIEIIGRKDLPTYGNGTNIVSYQGNLYYIEYGNSDFEIEAIRDPYYGNGSDGSGQRYLNVIDSRGNIKNLFKLSGTNYFGLIDDRFYLHTGSGLLYSVNMKGEDSIEFARGSYIDFDSDNHAVYYLTESNPNMIYRLDTKTNKIDKFDFNNPTSYMLLGMYNGNIYYASFDDKKNDLKLFEHVIASNTLTEVATEKVNLDTLEDYSGVTNQVVYFVKEGRYADIAIGDPCTGTMLGYYGGINFLIDLENKTFTKTFDSKDKAVAEEGAHYYDEFFVENAEKDLYKANFGKDLTSIHALVSDADIKAFAKRYGIDLDAKLENEGYDGNEDKFYISIEDHTVVGDKVIYKITASRRAPAHDIGWRYAYFRIASEVYLKNLSTGKKQFVYSYVNSNYDNQVKSLMEEIKVEEVEETLPSGSTQTSGEIIENEPVIEPEPVYELKEDEMYLDINLDNVWESEFDVKVEEVGGSILGKRIEYEGHHRKEDGNLRIIVSKEIGARLSVYINKDLHSQMIIGQ